VKKTQQAKKHVRKGSRPVCNAPNALVKDGYAPTETILSVSKGRQTQAAL